MNQRQKLEIGLGVFFCLISIGVFLVSTDFPNSPGPLDANTFPRLVASLLFIFSAALIYKNVKNINVKEKIVFDKGKKEYLYIFALIILILAYVNFVSQLGFSLTTIIIMVLIMYLLGERRKTILIVFPIAFVLTLYILFARMAMVPLPKGIIENLI